MNQEPVPAVIAQATSCMECSRNRKKQDQGNSIDKTRPKLGWGRCALHQQPGSIYGWQNAYLKTG